MLSLAGIAIGFAMKSTLIAAGVAACIEDQVPTITQPRFQ
jgi:hypothetical protein